MLNEFKHIEPVYPNILESLKSDVNTVEKIVKAFDDFLHDERNLWPKSNLELIKFYISEIYEDAKNLFAFVRSVKKFGNLRCDLLSNFLFSWKYLFRYISLRRFKFFRIISNIGEFGYNYQLFKKLKLKKSRNQHQNFLKSLINWMC